MPEVLEQQVTQGQTQTPPDDGGLAQELERVGNAAQQFIDQRMDVEPGVEDYRRDERGRFLPKGDAQPQATEPAPVETPSVDPVWLEAAKEAGLPEAAIAGLKTENEFVAAIEAQEYAKAKQYCDYLGIDPVEYQAWQQSRSQPQPTPQAVQTPAPTPAVVDEVIPEFTEDEFSPEQIAKLKPLVEQIRATKAALAVTQKLQSEVDAIKAQERQRVEAARKADFQQKQAARLNAASSKVPDIEAFFGGNLADVWRAVEINPNDRRAADLMAFNAYFDRAINTAMRALGDTDKAVEIAVRNAWNASPFSKVKAGANGTNNQSANGNGVVRHGPRRTESTTPEPSGDDLGAEMKAIADRLGIAWDNAGGNPFQAPRA